MRVFQTLLAFSGNAPPQLALTRELVGRGHEVRVVAHSAAQARIERTGAEFVPIRRWLPDLDITHPETDPIRDWEARTPLGAAKRMRDAPIAPLRDATRENVEMLRDWSADVIVFDWLFIAASVAAEHVGTPAVALVHCPYPLPVAGAPPLFSGLKPMGGPLGAARDRLLNAMTRRFTSAGLPMLNDVRAEHGLTPLSDWNDQVRGVQAIYVMTAPELDFSSMYAIRFLDQLVRRIVRQRRASREPRDDLLGRLLAAVDTEGDGQGMTERQLRDELVTLLLAGHETTGAALTWAGWLLASYPEIQERLAAGVGEVLGPRTANFADLPGLRHVEMAFKEAMRLHPPVYFFSREVADPVEVAGYPMRPGSQVFLFPYLTQRDPRWFPDPKLFDPWRFGP